MNVLQAKIPSSVGIVLILFEATISVLLYTSTVRAMAQEILPPPYAVRIISTQPLNYY